MSESKYKLGIAGSTGAVGTVALEVLEERGFPAENLRLFCSERSAGTDIFYSGKSITTEVLEKSSFDELDMCIFSAGGSVSREFVPACADAGCIAIDNTSAFRMTSGVPLVVPEVNRADLGRLGEHHIIANPNCSTIQMVVALGPLHAEFGLERVLVSTYQSTSGAGKRAIQELSDQVTSLFNNEDVKTEIFPHQIAFNCIPQVDVFEDNGYSREELKMVNETKKILHLPDLKISATTVRVPTFASHAESVYIETTKEPDIKKVRDVLEAAPGLIVIDDPKNSQYPLPFEATGKDEVFVGRVRRDLDVKNGLHLWVVADNLRKGAATNAVQIAEALAEEVH